MTGLVKVQPFPTTKFLTNGFFDEFFNRNIGEFMGSDIQTSNPAVNVTETPEAFQVELAAPGYNKQDITLNIEDSHLRVSAKREAKSEESEKGRFLRREFRYESFSRSFKLPNTVNQDSISAVYENGILNIVLPKKEDAKPIAKTIQVG